MSADGEAQTAAAMHVVAMTLLTPSWMEEMHSPIASLLLDGVKAGLWGPLENANEGEVVATRSSEMPLVNFILR